MSVQYLVDYENVHEAGVFGMDTLTADDCVYIFHTFATDRISLSRLDNVQAWVKVIPVPPGKQSLDKHLDSFLGYLIGKSDDDTRFAIVSHDGGYKAIADFWNRAFHQPDKVQCIHGINYSLGIVNPDAWISIPAESPVEEAELPDIMELGDLTIDDEPIILETENAVSAESKETESENCSVLLLDMNPPVENKSITELDFRTIAEESFRCENLLYRNTQGHVRASRLRDDLMKYPEFRVAQKESGMKPIPYLQHLLEGNMDFYREKGVFWVSKNKGPKDELAERKKSFFEAAFRSIRQRLTDMGIDPAAADEIAGICMRSDSETEPRKMIHTLLCQRFGEKEGAKYYRQAVKYISA